MDYSEEMKLACENAWSFDGIVPPIGSEFIGISKTDHGEYLFYKDTSGNYYYQSKASMNFEKELKEKRKQKNKNIIGSWNKKNISISY